MLTYIGSLPKEDRLTIELSRLYEQFGYKKYRMAKFEEYSFYSDNRDFLSSQGVIAFNNTDGRLMALKPDITLSIVKNARLCDAQAKSYYNESVYRISETTHDYREIKQSGVELLGTVDEYSTAEIILLALKSLELIDKDFVLCISHMGFISSLLENTGISRSQRKQLMNCIGTKNVHDLESLCLNYSVDNSLTDKLVELTKISGELKDVAQKLKALFTDGEAKNAADELAKLYSALKDTPFLPKVRFDFSVVNHIDYYNGIIFQGYVKQAPASVLAGGRYDRLASKIRRNVQAIGFAVYLDNLNLYYPKKRLNDTDILIINKGNSELLSNVIEFVGKGKTVRVETSIPKGYNADEIYVFENGELRRCDNA